MNRLGADISRVIFPPCKSVCAGLRWHGQVLPFMVFNTLRPEYDDVIIWKHFPRYWPFVRGIHRSPVDSPHKGQWRGALMFSLICTWINGWVNNRETGDLRRHHAHYDVTVMQLQIHLIERRCLKHLPRATIYDLYRRPARRPAIQVQSTLHSTSRGIFPPSNAEKTPLGSSIEHLLSY